MKLFRASLSIGFTFLALAGCGRSKGILMGTSSSSGNSSSTFSPFGNLNVSVGGSGTALTGSSNGSGSAGSSVSYRGLGDVTAFYLPSSIPTDYSAQLPYRLRFSGPTSIQTIECNEYNLEILNAYSQVVGVPSGKTMMANLSDDGSVEVSKGVSMGAFFLDNNCKVPAGTVTYKAGESRKKVYYLNATATISGTHRLLKADADYEGHTVIGRFAIDITNNPKFASQVGVNFEDWHDYDYNDSVVCLPGTVYYDGSVIRSYGNQTINFSVFDTTSTSACSHSITISVYDEDLFTKARTLRRKIFVANDHSAGASYDVAFTFNSVLEVSFYTYPGSICAETEGQNFSMGSNRVRVENVCRTGSGEGVAVP